MKQIMNRLQQPTPPFFQKVRNIGLVIAAVGTSIIAAPVALPALLVTIAGYLVVAGGVMSTLGQAAIKREES
jgi:ABC-type xylose transport system permease subunit